MASQADTIDLADVVRSLRRGWRSVLAYTALGLIGAAGVMLFAPRQYRGTASVVLRSAEPLGGLTRLMGNSGMLGGSDAAEVLTGGRSQMETELQILNSRDVAGVVLDSLRLQARVKAPRGTPPWRLLTDLNLPRSFRKKTITFTRAGDGRVRMVGAGLDTIVATGVPVNVLGGTITLAADVPDFFKLRMLDREDALDRFDKRLNGTKAGGEVARIDYEADDSLTAARVPNIVVGAYLVRRKSTDRGVNQHRVEFLTVQVDSTEKQLSLAERTLRRFQESSGVLSAEVVGKVAIERGGELRSAMAQAEVEEGAVNQLLRQVANGTMDRRHLAGFPSFAKGSSLNELIVQLAELDAERLMLLERRTERDPEVQALAKSIAAVEELFVPMAQAYSASLKRTRVELAAQLDSLRAELGVLPAAAESGNRLQRDVIRLGQIYGGLQAQLVQARLAAIGEGGEVRQLDVSTVPKKPVFPRPWPTFGAGGLAGLVAGIIAALALSTFGRWARDPIEIERTTGVRAVVFDRRVPLIVANGATRAVLVVPLHPLADTMSVAKQLVETAMSRALNATLLDLGSTTVKTGGPSVDANGTINRLGSSNDLVVVRLPAMTSDVTLAALSHERSVVLVVPNGRVAREELIAAMETLRRLEVPCAGIVASGGTVRQELSRGTEAVAT
jgi:uncharacterized protein involved in exopolysaccharide biosynthesis